MGVVLLSYFNTPAFQSAASLQGVEAAVAQGGVEALDWQAFLALPASAQDFTNTGGPCHVAVPCMLCLILWGGPGPRMYPAPIVAA